MPQKTTENNMTPLNAINSKTNSSESLLSFETTQPQKSLAASQCPRRLATTVDCEAGTISNLGQNKSRNPKNETPKKVDDPVGNYRLSIDESVLSALFECSYVDSKHEILGYLGGTCDIDRLNNNAIVCRVSQFVASERIITSLLTDSVQEIVQARDNAISTFNELGLELVGWYRSNLHLSSNSIPTQNDINKHQRLQSQFPYSVGVIVSVSSVSCPPINTRTPVMDGMLNSLCVFRTPAENNNSNGDNAVKSKNGKIWKGKGKECHKANKLAFAVNRQMYMCPNVMQQLSCALMTILRESKQIYSGQVLDCGNRNGQRILVDSQYEAFLMNFLKKSVLQFDRSIDQDFRSLAVAKHHVKELITRRVNETLATCQRHSVSNECEMQLKREKFERLIEKLVTQRISKREDAKNSESTDGVIRWLNKRASNYDQQKTSENFALGSEVTMSSTSGDSVPTNKVPFTSSEQSFRRQVTPTKESSPFINVSSGQTQTSFMDNVQEDKGVLTDAMPKEKLTDINETIKDEIVPASRDTGDECSAKKTTKQLLRRSSVDASHVAPPNSKKIKIGPNPTKIDFGGVHVQAAAFPDSKSAFGSTSVINGSSIHHSNNKSTPQSSQYSPSSVQLTAKSSPTFNTTTTTTPPPPPSVAASAASNSLGTNGIQYPINNSYSYPSNGYRSFHGSSEDLSTCNGNKPTSNCSQGSGIHLPSIQGLLEISHSIPPPPPQSPLPSNVMTVDSNSSGMIHASFSSPMLPYQNNLYPFGTQLPQPQNLIQPGTPPTVASIPHPIHQINSTASSPSANSRHYIPIAPSPSPSPGNRPPLQPSQQATTIYSSSTRYPSTDSDYHRW